MSDEHNCAICLEALEEDQTYTVPECGHKFRSSNNTCPYCRGGGDFNGFHPLHSTRDVVKLYQRLARRKACPPAIKKMCMRITQAKKKYREQVSVNTAYRRANREVLNGFSKLRGKRWRLARRCRALERELCAQPMAPLLAFFR